MSILSNLQLVIALLSVVQTANSCLRCPLQGGARTSNYIHKHLFLIKKIGENSIGLASNQPTGKPPFLNFTSWNWKRYLNNNPPCCGIGTWCGPNGCLKSWASKLNLDGLKNLWQRIHLTWITGISKKRIKLIQHPPIISVSALVSAF